LISSLAFNFKKEDCKNLEGLVVNSRESRKGKVEVIKIEFRGGLVPYPGNTSGFGDGYLVRLNFNKVIAIGTIFHLQLFGAEDSLITIKPKAYFDNESPERYVLKGSPEQYTMHSKINWEWQAHVDFSISLAGMEEHKRLEDGKEYKMKLYMDGKRIFEGEATFTDFRLGKSNQEKICCPCGRSPQKGQYK
ncbi:MAG: hypothetical protein ICV53_18400, partial [Flavisolibacter sp.]|nr:hypothetical protein [Flavisolibacter sp.]